MDWDPQYFNNVPNICKNAPIISYQIHGMIWEKVPKQVAEVVTFQRKFIEHFDLVGKPNCTFKGSDPAPHQQEMCLWEIDWEPAGPFNNAQFAIFIPTKDLQRAVEWSAKNRGSIDILVHPNTGCQVEDYSVWASWNGTPWQLDTTFFTCNAPYPICH